ncbi:competence protein CoiA family protein [Vibrio aestuarianus]|uniref:competence protein CoiA family protein n=1 Tax=Vibrio aestuarianus TaxID=28171 RepID=UPI0020CD37DF|nr:competence protein CoiA family protein [Vibrio aestuarianus]MDE1311372.1 competence protein CoiA [Vibrio aestuarianus]
MSEIHITRAVDKNTKASVSIESVESGLQDNIVCACCGAKLIANKGKKRAWYFSHYFDEVCILAYETQLHLTAKEYFAKVGKIPLPLDIGWVTPDACSELNISGVQVEVYMDGRRPDLVVEVGSEQYWVEIANKHKCEADKIWDCRTNGKNVIEIDVSDCGQLD